MPEVHGGQTELDDTTVADSGVQLDALELEVFTGLLALLFEDEELDELELEAVEVYHALAAEELELRVSQRSSHHARCPISYLELLELELDLLAGATEYELEDEPGQLSLVELSAVATAARPPTRIAANFIVGSVFGSVSSTGRRGVGPG